MRTHVRLGDTSVSIRKIHPALFLLRGGARMRWSAVMPPLDTEVLKSAYFVSKFLVSVPCDSCLVLPQIRPVGQSSHRQISLPARKSGATFPGIGQSSGKSSIVINVSNARSAPSNPPARRTHLSYPVALSLETALPPDQGDRSAPSVWRRHASFGARRPYK